MDERRGWRILVVDDEASIRVTLETLLRRKGYTVISAATGTEALAHIMRDTFDLFLIDLLLPGMSGLELAQAARRHQPTAAVLILTGSTDLVDKPLQAQLQAFPYLLKTVDPREVLARIADLLSG